MSQNQCKSLDEFEKKMKCEIIPDNFIMTKGKNKLLYINVNSDDIPYLDRTITIDADLKVSFFMRDAPITEFIDYKLPFKCNNVKEFSDFLKKCDQCNIQSSSDPKQLTKLASDTLSPLNTEMPEKQNKISFLQEQIKTLALNKYSNQYSYDTVITSSLIFSISPHAYHFLRNSDILTLPHPNTLRRLCSNCEVNPNIEQNDNNFLLYIKMKFKYLTDDDHFVVLLLDEIHVKAYVDFKGGHIVGQADDSEIPATSAHVFMIQSLLSGYRDVVHILPIRSISAEKLHFYLLKIINGLEKIGFKVLCICSDNSINRKAVSYFSSPPQLSIVYGHPFDSKRPLFYMIDFVHLLKCIRNNWINQKNLLQTLYFPNFFNPEIIQEASWSVLKKLQQQESENILKYGYGISLKALHPNNLERQNVKLVLQLFNQHVIEGIRIVANDDDDDFKIHQTLWNLSIVGGA